jgi:uncharacterized small protein (DUF1192 family)
MSEEHREQADAVERELDDMDEQAGELQEEIEATKADWERKREDDSVPGAPPPED